MPEAIDDAFSSIPGRQRRYQLRNRAEGTCVGCRNPTEHGKRYCPACIKRTAEKRAKSATLHKAAPTLLEVLCRCQRFLDRVAFSSELNKEARAAIAAAEGRQLL